MHLTFSRTIQAAIDLLDRALVSGSESILPRMGVLADDDVGLLERYSNVPPEAFPFLDERADGCHFALWIDDPAEEREPCAVRISPMDGTPETVISVAATVQDFLALASAVGWPMNLYEQPDLASAHERRVRERRVREAVHVTRDGMGVVAPAERAAERPSEQQLRAWSRAEGHAAFAREVGRWIRDGRAGFAVAVCRDLIADFAPDPHVAPLCAEAYRAMGRGLLASIAERSYR